jgi:hypothetical protein
MSRWTVWKRRCLHGDSCSSEWVATEVGRTDTYVLSFGFDTWAEAMEFVNDELSYDYL